MLVISRKVYTTKPNTPQHKQSITPNNPRQQPQISTFNDHNTTPPTPSVNPPTPSTRHVPTARTKYFTKIGFPMPLKLTNLSSKTSYYQLVDMAHYCLSHITAAIILPNSSLKITEALPPTSEEN